MFHRAKKVQNRTPAVRVAVAMTTKDSIPLSTGPIPLENANVQALFAQALARAAQKLRQWFLPHLVGGIGLFLLMAYVTSATLFAHWASVWKWLAICLVLAGYGVVAFCYSFFTTCILAVRLVCVEWNDFIDHVLTLVQDQTAHHLADMNVGLSKPEATHLVRGSVREVFGAMKTKQTGLARGFIILCLGLLAAAVRAVLSAKIIKWSGRTVQLGKLFAGRATLVGAIFLNLHFFATLLLAACYALGLLVLAVNIYFVFLLK